MYCLIDEKRDDGNPAAALSALTSVSRTCKSASIVPLALAQPFNDRLCKPRADNLRGLAKYTRVSLSHFVHTVNRIHMHTHTQESTSYSVTIRDYGPPPASMRCGDYEFTSLCVRMCAARGNVYSYASRAAVYRSMIRNDATFARTCIGARARGCIIIVIIEFQL